MRTKFAVRLLLSLFVMLALSHGAFAQVGFRISVNFAPPPIPVYEQPICPADGYLWVPGYWAYDDDDGYYWVPGTWVEAPEVGYLWTPGYWGWNNDAYVWNEGYWGPEVGFYGGIDYGFGYYGTGFGGGEWRGREFYYNTAVMQVNTTVIRNVYVNRTVIVNHNSRVAFNGGQGGVQARATAREERYSHERHVPPVSAQTRHIQQARGNPELRASTNRGRPPIAATARAADLRSGVVASRQAGGEYKAPPPRAARGTEMRPAGNENRPSAESRPGTEARPNPENRSESRREASPGGGNHARDLQPHQYTPPNSGNAAADRKYQQQQEKLSARQAQDHQKLQQQQEREHQQATKRSYNDARQQQMETRHTQQTQQLEQRHTTQQRQMEQRQAPRPESRPPAEKRH